MQENSKKKKKIKKNKPENFKKKKKINKTMLWEKWY